MTFREMLENTKEGNPKHNAGYNHDFYIIKRQGDIYVNIKYEWWRNQRDSDGEEFSTVESLIEEVKKSHYLSYYDQKLKNQVNYQGAIDECNLLLKIVNHDYLIFINS
jgi:hypothetical protein